MGEAGWGWINPLTLTLSHQGRENLYNIFPRQDTTITNKKRKPEQQQSSPDFLLLYTGYSGLVRWRDRSRFLCFHRLVTAGGGTIASLGAKDFRSALGAAISLTQLISHSIMPPFRFRNLLLHLHGLAATGQRAITTLGYHKLGATLGTAVSLTYLICHLSSSLRLFSIAVYSVSSNIICQ
jgi:hypothetical protein